MDYKETKKDNKRAIFDIELNKIKPNPFQPRIYFDNTKLESLANSISQYGVLQPIVVSKIERYQEGVGVTSEYEIIVGERRFRAAKLAGLERIPAVIRDDDYTDTEKLELAIIENLQREDLNPIDQAKAFRKLTGDFGLKHAEVAKKLGKSREFVSNSLRLLLLPTKIQEAVSFRQISEGHAKPLLMLKERPEEQMILFRKIMSNKLTVRSTERIAREIAVDKVRKSIILDPEIKAVEKKLSEKLGTKVLIEQKKEGGSGKITIEYFSKEDLEAILKNVNNQSDINDLEQQINSETPTTTDLADSSLYDAFLVSKKEIEQEKEEGLVDKSIGQKINKVNDISFNLPKDSELSVEPDVLKEEQNTENIEISSVVTGSDFLTAKTDYEEKRGEDGKTEKTVENEEKSKDTHSFKNFSI